MITKSQLVHITELGIDNLLIAYMTNPYFFYTENDLHCYLYSEIYGRLSPEEWLCQTQDNKTSILLHKEYPTKIRYSAKELKPNVPRGTRGHFDLSIWSPDNTNERLFRVTDSTDFDKEQQTFIAIEFDLTEGNNSLDEAVHHLKWDLLKLSGAQNQVEHGYSVVFVRDWIYSNEFLKQVKNETAKEQKITVLYAEINKDEKLFGTLSEKSFLNYTRLF